jgi:hypothetical protein
VFVRFDFKRDMHLSMPNRFDQLKKLDSIAQRHASQCSPHELQLATVHNHY